MGEILCYSAIFINYSDRTNFTITTDAILKNRIKNSLKFKFIQLYMLTLKHFLYQM